MLGTLPNTLATLLTQVMTLIPFIIGFALLIAGGILALGNHQRGKEGVIAALIGGAIMLSSQSIGQGFHG